MSRTVYHQWVVCTRPTCLPNGRYLTHITIWSPYWTDSVPGTGTSQKSDDPFRLSTLFCGGVLHHFLHPFTESLETSSEFFWSSKWFPHPPLEPRTSTLPRPITTLSPCTRVKDVDSLNDVLPSRSRLGTLPYNLPDTPSSGVTSVRTRTKLTPWLYCQ